MSDVIGSLKATWSINNQPLMSGLKQGAKALSAFEKRYKNATDVDLRANYKGLLGDLKTASRSLNSFQREAQKGATVEVRERGAKQTVASMSAVGKARSSLDGQSATVEIGQRGAAQTSMQVGSVRTLMAELGATKATVTVDENGALKTAFTLKQVNDEADKINNRRLVFGIDPSQLNLFDRLNTGLSETATRIRSVQTVGATAAIPVFIAGIAGIVPVATSAGAALGGLASAAGQGLAGGLGAGLSAMSGFTSGIGLLYAAAFPTIKAFSDLESNSNALSTAQNGLSTATEGVATAENSARSAAQSLADARREVTDRTEDHARAQQDLNWALEDEPTNQRYAVLDLADAQDRAEETLEAYTEAVRKYGRNSEEASDAARDHKRAQLDLSQQMRDTQRIQENGSAGLVSAKDSEKAASEGVAAAQRNEKQAAAELSRANAEVSKALAEVATAQAEVTANSKGLTASQAGLLGVWRNVSAMAGKLFKPANDDLNNLAASTLNYVSGALPSLGRTAQYSVWGLSRAIEFLKTTLGSGGQLALFEKFLGAVPNLLSGGVVAAGSFGGAVFNMLVAAIPAAKRLTGALAFIGESFRSWSASAEGQTALTAFFDSASRKGAVLIGVVRDLVLGVVGLGGAFDESGLSGRMLSGLSDMAARFRAFTASGSEGRAMLVSFSQAAQPTLDATWRLLGGIFTEWGRVADALVRARDESGKLIVPAALDGIRNALPVIGDLLISTFQRFGPMIGPLISGVAGLLKAFIALNPVLHGVSRLIVGTLTAFNNLPRGMQTAIVSAASLISIMGVLGISMRAASLVASGTFSPILGATAFGMTKTGIAADSAAAKMKLLRLAMVGLPVAAGAAGIVALAANWGKVTDKMGPAGDLLQKVTARMNEANNVQGILKNGVGGLKDAFTDANGVSGLWANGLDGLKQRFTDTEGASGGVQKAWGAVTGWLTKEWQQTADGAKRIWGGITGAVTGAFSGITGAIGAVFAGIKNVITTQFQLIDAATGGRISGFVNKVVSGWNSLRSGASSVFSSVKNTVVGAFNSIAVSAVQGAARVVSVVTGAWNTLRGATSAAWNGIKAVVTPVFATIANVVRSGINLVRSVVVAGWNAIRTATAPAWNAIRTVVGGVWNFISGLVRRNLSIIRTTVQTAWRAIRATTTGVFNGIRNFFGGFWNYFRGLWRGNTQQAAAGIRQAWFGIRQVTLSVWNGIWAFFRVVWNGIKAVVTSTLQGIRSGIVAAWNFIKSNTSAAWDAVRNFMRARIQDAARIVRDVVIGLKNGLSDTWNAVKSGAQTAWQKIRDFIADPIETAVDRVKSALQSAVGVVNAVLKAFGQKTISVNFGGSPGTSERSGGRPTTGAFAKGGIAGSGVVEGFADGGMGTSGKNPRMHLWNEQQGGEAFIAEKRPAKEQLPYLQTAADWHGYAVIPANPAKPKIKHADYTSHGFAEGGVIPVQAFAAGGKGAMYQAVLSKFGVKGRDFHSQYLTGSAAVNSIDWMVTADGNRATGSEKELGDRIAAFTAPPSAKNTIWYGRANWGGGWVPYSTGPGIGNANTLGHYDHVHAEAHPDSFRGGKGTFPGGSGGGGTSMGPSLADQIWLGGSNPPKDWKAAIKGAFVNTAIRSIPIIGGLLGAAKDAYPGLEKILPKRPGELVGGLGSGVIAEGIGAYSEKYKGWIKDYIYEKFGSTGGESGPYKGGGNLDEWAKNGLILGNAFPPTASNISKIKSRAMQESGGDPNAVNDWDSNAAAGTPSKGLMQVIEPTWNANTTSAIGQFASNWNDPVKSVGVASRYMKSAYGYVVGATGQGYDKGGLIPGRDGETAIIKAHAGEIVLPRAISTTFVDFTKSLPSLTGSLREATRFTERVPEHRGDFQRISQRVERIERNVGGGNLSSDRETKALLTEVRDAVRVLNERGIEVDVRDIKERGAAKINAGMKNTARGEIAGRYGQKVHETQARNVEVARRVRGGVS